MEKSTAALVESPTGTGKTFGLQNCVWRVACVWLQTLEMVLKRSIICFFSYGCFTWVFEDVQLYWVIYTPTTCHTCHFQTQIVNISAGVGLETVHGTRVSGFQRVGVQGSFCNPTNAQIDQMILHFFCVLYSVHCNGSLYLCSLFAFLVSQFLLCQLPALSSLGRLVLQSATKFYWGDVYLAQLWRLHISVSLAVGNCQSI
jgi:hypothetical protein